MGCEQTRTNNLISRTSSSGNLGEKLLNNEFRNPRFFALILDRTAYTVQYCTCMCGSILQHGSQLYLI